MQENTNGRFLELNGGWEPYLTVDDAKRLDEFREALRRGDLESASRHGQVYILTPVASLTDSRDHVTP
jgi:hypothetical protein